MKKTLLIFASITILFSVAKAQINMTYDGKVMIGSSTLTPIAPLHVFGSTYLPLGNSYWIGATNDAGPRLRLHNDGQSAFIDFYQNLFFRTGLNWSSVGVAMHPNGSMSIGYSYSTYLYSSPAYPLDVNGSINANGNIYLYGAQFTSDGRLKKNIEDLGDNKSKLFKLKGVKFDFISEKPVKQNNSSQLPNSIANNTSNTDTLKYVPPTSIKLSPDVTSRKHFGFIAQDLQKIFPELVCEDKEGYLSVDYIGIIPMLVEALKGQDSILTIQATQIKELQNLVKNCGLKSAQLSSVVNPINPQEEAPSLDQNFPNPFNQSTQIGYYLPDASRTAVLYVYNMNGLQIKSIPIQSRGKGSVIIHGSELVSGMYIYTLIVDGKEIDTKRMILTQ
jgi:hypothetical protein